MRTSALFTHLATTAAMVWGLASPGAAQTVTISEYLVPGGVTQS
ncbi:MAG: hypothetical protein V9G24_05860 [Rhodoblastus sp.]